MLNKQNIETTININSQIEKGLNDKTKTYKNYSVTVKPLLDEFKNKFDKSSGSLLKEELDKIIKENDLQSHIKSRSSSNHGNFVLYPYVWATLFNKNISFKDSIQLYISIDHAGVKFGIGYGDNIKTSDSSDSKFVNIIKNDKSICEKLFSIIDNEPNMNFYNDHKTENVISAVNLASLWSNRSEIVGRFNKEEIPDNVVEIIHNVLTELAPVFNEIVLKSKRDENMPVNEPNPKMKNQNKDEEGDSKPKSPLNQIFYGPPGTGKTYKLKNELFPKYTSKETSLTKEKYFENVIANCSWWQVIAVALIQLGEVKVADIIEHPWVKKRAELSKANNIRPIMWSRLQSHTVNECENVNVTSKSTPLIFSKDENSFWKIETEIVDELAPEIYDLINSVDNFEANPDKEIKRYKFITFHQSFSYEDFIEGLKPKLMNEETTEKEDLSYTIESGVFKEICKNAERDPENQYALFIDEINRGNISSIFGELITLIELDKRTGTENELSCVLPYSKSEFSVPKNLDIYGTMNTADRSVEALDTALRRRFSFVEMMPNYELIDKEIQQINLKDVLTTINERIEILIDRDHTIGHSYFINVENEEDLANAFNDNIVPLLQEYFYGDYGKIGLVLGKGFVKTNKNTNIKFAQFDYDNSSDFITKKQTLIKQNEDIILESIKLLLNKPEA